MTLILLLLAGLFGASKAGERVEAALDRQRQEDACFERAEPCLLTQDGRIVEFRAREPMSLDEWAKRRI